MVEIHTVEPAETRPLRQRVLRPHQTLEELAHPGETLPEAGVFAALVANEVVGTALVFRQERLEKPAAHSWRLVAIAVDPAHQRTGIGAGLIERCLRHIESHGGDEVWCHARIDAIPFYESGGFLAEGEEWIEEHTGPHVLMWRPV